VVAAGGRPRRGDTGGGAAASPAAGQAGGMREEPPLTVSEAAASTTSFKDQSRAVDGPEPSTTGVGSRPRPWPAPARPPRRPAAVRVNLAGLVVSPCLRGEEIPHGPKEQAGVTGGRPLSVDTKPCW
jgi:hypothetical protein